MRIKNVHKGNWYIIAIALHVHAVSSFAITFLEQASPQRPGSLRCILGGELSA